MSVNELYTSNNDKIFADSGVIDHLDAGDNNCALNIGTRPSTCRINISSAGGPPVYIYGILVPGVTGATGEAFNGITGPVNAIDNNGIINYGNGIIGLEFATNVNSGIVSDQDQSFQGIKSFEFIFCPFLSAQSGPNSITSIGGSSTFTSIGSGAMAQYIISTPGITGDNMGAWGTASMDAVTNGLDTYAIGDGALSAATTVANTFVFGVNGLIQALSASNCIAIGNQVGAGVTGHPADMILIGTDGVDAVNGDIIIGEPGVHLTNTQQGIFTEVVSAAAEVFIDANGKLGLTASVREKKQDIADLDVGSKIEKLKPCSFRIKNTKNPEQLNPLSLGLIYDEVIDLFPELCVQDKDGNPLTLRYDLLAVPLLKHVQELTDRVSLLEKLCLKLSSDK